MMKFSWTMDATRGHTYKISQHPLTVLQSRRGWNMLSRKKALFNFRPLLIKVSHPTRHCSAPLIPAGIDIKSLTTFRTEEQKCQSLWFAAKRLWEWQSGWGGVLKNVPLQSARSVTLGIFVLTLLDKLLTPNCKETRRVYSVVAMKAESLGCFECSPVLTSET